jgi:hypothetical protein
LTVGELAKQRNLSPEQLMAELERIGIRKAVADDVLLGWERTKFFESTLSAFGHKPTTQTIAQLAVALEKSPSAILAQLTRADINKTSPADLIHGWEKEKLLDFLIQKGKMLDRPVTIKVLAKELNVSITTVLKKLSKQGATTPTAEDLLSSREAGRLRLYFGMKFASKTAPRAGRIHGASTISTGLCTSCSKKSDC